MSDVGVWTTIVFVADLAVRVGLSIRVIMRRLPVGVSLAWLFVILVFPFVGAFAYALLGELRLGRRRASRAAALHGPYRGWLNELTARANAAWSALPRESQPLARLAEAAIGLPPVGGNRLELLGKWEPALRAIIRDIDAAETTCHLEFYIWNEGGLADEVGQALIRAAQRGVVCRLLVDDMGSRRFLRGQWAERLRQAGVQVHAALPARLWRAPFVRFDLRLHRKLVVIDGRVAYTGSLNLVDPRYFKQEAGVGEWIDAMVRIQGPVVEPLAITFLEDWSLETDTRIEELRATGGVRRLDECGTATVQVVPSGPADPAASMERVLLATIYQAQRELVLTTPYFVPDESMITALLSAAQRGVEVTLVLPARVDSKLVNLARRSFQNELAAAGARVMLFEAGLLHTKSVTVDGTTSLFGSLNLDPRSLHLNFELTLAVYDAAFTAELRALQESYCDLAQRLDPQRVARRPFQTRLLENSARLLGPLL